MLAHRLRRCANINPAVFVACVDLLLVRLSVMSQLQQTFSISMFDQYFSKCFTNVSDPGPQFSHH